MCCSCWWLLSMKALGVGLAVPYPNRPIVWEMYYISKNTWLQAWGLREEDDHDNWHDNCEREPWELQCVSLSRATPLPLVLQSIFNCYSLWLLCLVTKQRSLVGYELLSWSPLWIGLIPIASRMNWILLATYHEYTGYHEHPDFYISLYPEEMPWRFSTLQAFFTSQTCSGVRICCQSQVQTSGWGRVETCQSKTLPRVWLR